VTGFGLASVISRLQAGAPPNDCEICRLGPGGGAALRPGTGRAPRPMESCGFDRGKGFFVCGQSVYGYIPASDTIMSPNKVLWIYIVLLVIGGLIGFFKGKSQVSLIMSVCFAAALSLCAAGIIFYPYVADILLAALIVVFAMRLTKTKKFMPSGLMLVLTVAALALRHVRI